MAQPYPFLGFSNVFRAPPGLEGEVGSCPAYVGENEIITCWELTPEELEEVKSTGLVWLSFLSEGLVPHKIMGEAPMYYTNPLTGVSEKYRADGSCMVDAAMEFARVEHEGQKYSNDHPYTYHLGKVVSRLIYFGCGWEEQAAGWLHDFVEDCRPEETPEERLALVQRYFGDVIAKLVWSCTGIGVNRKARNADQYEKIAAYPRAAILKMADRIENMQACIDFMNESKSGMYIKEAQSFFDHVGIHAPQVIQDYFWDTHKRLSETFHKDPK